MPIPAIISFGFGNGTFSTTVNHLPTLGYGGKTLFHAGIPCFETETLTAPSLTVETLTAPTLDSEAIEVC
jgi:hypothetical protein